MARGRDALAVSLLCLGIFVFSFQDVVVKALSGVYPVHQIVLIRSAASLPVLFAFLALTVGLRALLSPHLGLLLLRGALLVLSYTGYYMAFPAMNLADVIALASTAPLFIAALAGPVLGERIDARRWAAVAVGFLGALIMLRPGAGIFDFASLLPIAGAFAYAAAQIMTRRLGGVAPAAVMTFHQNLVYFAAAAALALAVTLSGPSDYDHPSLSFLLSRWSMPNAEDLVLMAACGPIAVLGTTLLAQAYRSAEANLIAPFEYTGLIWATLWGYGLWAETPGLPSLAGGALIVASGLYVISGGPARAAPRAVTRPATADA